jgi:hypothetical protein
MTVADAAKRFADMDVAADAMIRANAARDAITPQVGAEAREYLLARAQRLENIATRLRQPHMENAA